MKPIIIMCSGITLEILEQKIYSIANKDFFAVTINSFMHKEDLILRQINRSFDCIYLSDADCLNFYINQIGQFLARDSNKCFITSMDYWDKLRFLGLKYNHKTNIIISSYAIGTGSFCRDRGYNSTMACILTFIGLGHRKFFIFGMDGGGEYYHLEKEFRSEKQNEEMIQADHPNDNRVMDQFFWKESNVITMDHIEIFNVSIDSKIEVFPKITFNEFLERI